MTSLSVRARTAIGISGVALLLTFGVAGCASTPTGQVTQQDGAVAPDSPDEAPPAQVQGGTSQIGGSFPSEIPLAQGTQKDAGSMTSQGKTISTIIVDLGPNGTVEMVTGPLLAAGFTESFSSLAEGAAMASYTGLGYELLVTVGDEEGTVEATYIATK